MRVVVEASGFRASWDPNLEVWQPEDEASEGILALVPPSTLYFSSTCTPQPDYSRGEDLVNRLAAVDIEAKIVEPAEPPPIEWEEGVIY